jgi:hypothetical protein
MSDAFEDTSLFKKVRATPTAPDPMQDKVELQVVADAIFEKLGSRAPAPKLHESDSDYMVRIGEQACCYGPEERKHIDRRKLFGPALTEFVRQDLQIAAAEAHTPNHSLKDGELREVIKEDGSGRPIYEFYSKTGPSTWMDSFKEPVMRYVSGGSKGIRTPDSPKQNTYNFIKSQTSPEIAEMRRQAAYADSPEARIIKAYREAGEPEERLGVVLQQFRRRNSA